MPPEQQDSTLQDFSTGRADGCCPSNVVSIKRTTILVSSTPGGCCLFMPTLVRFAVRMVGWGQELAVVYERLLQVN